MNILRFFNKIYAIIFGYFWLPCPICGEYFGGHEESGTLYISYIEGESTCKNCKNKAEEVNKKNNYFIPKYR